MFLQQKKAVDRIPSDFYYFSYIDRIFSSFSVLKRNIHKLYFLFKIHKISCEHYVRQTIILRQLRNISFDEFLFHQSERGIGIRHLDFKKYTVNHEYQRIF